jgi:hypothetical protein
MSSNLTPEQEYQLVYQGICAVAARCDGAVEEDAQGFNGQDTHFGRRIASVSFDTWTPEVRQEAARIANRYQVQIQTYTGIDVTTLQVVAEAKGIGTVHAARDDARAFERRANGASKLACRKIDAVDGGQLGIFYAKGDPDFGALLDTCKALPGRHFDWGIKANVVPLSEAIEDFVLTWDFPLTEAAQAILAQGVPEHFDVTLADNGEKLILDTPYEANLVEAIRTLPGRSYVGGSINHVDIHPRVLDLVISYGLKVHPDARAALSRAEDTLAAKHAADLAEGDLKVLMSHVSRLHDPTTLPAAFEDLLTPVLSAYGATGVLS